MINYQEFKNLVPKETADLIDFVLPYLDDYYERNSPPQDIETRSIVPYSVNFLLLLYAMAQNPDYEAYFSQYGFQKEKIMPSPQNLAEIKTLDILFIKYGSIIPNLNDPLDYEFLTPIDILLPVLNNYWDYCNQNVYYKLFPQSNNFSSFEMNLIEYNKAIKNKRRNELELKTYEHLPINVISYLETASKIRTKLLKREQEHENDLIPLSLVLAIYFYDEIMIDTEENISEKDAIINFWTSHNITLHRMVDLLSFTDSINDVAPNISAIKRLYKRYYTDGVYELEKTENVSVSGILENVFDRDFTNSILVEKLFSRMNCSISSFEHFRHIIEQQLKTQYQEYQKNEDEKRKIEEARKLITSYSTSCNYLFIIFQIQQTIKNWMEQEDVKIRFIHNEDDLKECSMVLGILMTENHARKFFEKHNITKEKILDVCGIDPKLLDQIDTNTDGYELDFLKLQETYKPYLDNSNKTIDEFAKDIFFSPLNKSMFLETLIEYMQEDYDTLKIEVKSGKDFELTLTPNERITWLIERPIDSLNLDDMKSILHFGNSLLPYSKYIYEELPKLIRSDRQKDTIESINKMVEQLNGKRKTSWISKLLSNFGIETRKGHFDFEAVKHLQEVIATNIEKLSHELLEYEYIRKYIEIYRTKNFDYYRLSKTIISQLQTKLGELNSQNDNQYFDYLTVSSKLQIMNEKVNRFEMTNHLMTQELMKVTQAIVSHFITINALEMARDDLMPLIESELMIGEGNKTEKDSLQISQSVIQLLQALLNGNVESAKQNIELLKNFNVSPAIFQTLNNDIQVHLQNFYQAELGQKRLNDSNMSQVRKRNVQSNTHINETRIGSQSHSPMKVKLKRIK